MVEEIEGYSRDPYAYLDEDNIVKFLPPKGFGGTMLNEPQYCKLTKALEILDKLTEVTARAGIKPIRFEPKNKDITIEAKFRYAEIHRDTILEIIENFKGISNFKISWSKDDCFKVECTIPDILIPVKE